MPVTILWKVQVFKYGVDKKVLHYSITQCGVDKNTLRELTEMVRIIQYRSWYVFRKSKYDLPILSIKLKYGEFPDRLYDSKTT